MFWGVAFWKACKKATASRSCTATNWSVLVFRDVFSSQVLMSAVVEPKERSLTSQGRLIYSYLSLRASIIRINAPYVVISAVAYSGWFLKRNWEANASANYFVIGVAALESFSWCHLEMRLIARLKWCLESGNILTMTEIRLDILDGQLVLGFPHAFHECIHTEDRANTIRSRI